MVIPIRDVRIRARFDLVATLFECFLRRVATCLGNFIVSVALCSSQVRSLPIFGHLSHGLYLSTFFLVRDDGCVGAQRQSVQSAFI
jgi:hypothetical protein